MSTYREYTVAELQYLVATHGYVRFRPWPEAKTEYLIHFTAAPDGTPLYQVIDEGGLHRTHRVNDLKFWSAQFYAPASESDWLLAELAGTCRLEDDDATQAQ